MGQVREESDSIGEAMTTAVFKTQSGEHIVTRKQLLAAMNEFDLRYRATEQDAGTIYAVEEGGKRYPPKRILELATGVPREKFYGGEPSNNVFHSLGFLISKVHPEMGWITPEEIALEQARLKSPIPNIDELLKDLFASTWLRLHDDYAKLADSGYPGVYVLAYTDEDLVGRRVNEQDIYYVGVSHVGVRKRLRQFIIGLEDGGHHSGAKRFFFDVAKQIPYSKFAGRKAFFVSSVSVPCTYLKNGRTPLDLQKLGVVAELEWYVLAYVKEKVGSEPWLNKK